MISPEAHPDICSARVVNKREVVFCKVLEAVGVFRQRFFGFPKELIEFWYCSRPDGVGTGVIALRRPVLYGVRLVA